jgi:hypothetical protein
MGKDAAEQPDGALPRARELIGHDAYGGGHEAAAAGALDEATGDEHRYGRGQRGANDRE